ncbi:MAG: hypothetical protein ABIY70_18300 [Capsulimonas sp.]|uniref:hypothetical protein n=1 Tax=Capsulimonas sp. TaxID=2494211 RepID=UPI003263D992
MANKVKVKGVHLFAPIQRVDETTRTVTAYAFVNEVVEGEGGIRLKRTAMEAATPDYMAWANIRRMHQPDAVGIAESVDWDATGAKLTIKVVDDDAWEKCRTGVYKGLSVGVSATVMRGKDVESCKWFETSLVDRPKDPGAVFIAVRAEGLEDGEEEFEAEQLERAEGPRSFAAMMAANNMWDNGYEALDALFSALIDICYSDADDKEALARESCSQFADYIAPIVGGGTLPKERAAHPDLTRVVTLETDNAALITRAEAAETDLVRVQGLLSTAEGQVRVLERRAADIKPPVRYPHAVDRTFHSQEDDPDAAALDEKRTELARLCAERPTDPAEQQQLVHRIQVLKQQLGPNN